MPSHFSMLSLKRGKLASIFVWKRMKPSCICIGTFLTNSLLTIKKAEKYSHHTHYCNGNYIKNRNYLSFS